jgi:hypothetical protein
VLWVDRSVGLTYSQNQLENLPLQSPQKPPTQP